ncbi:reverse transcriptase domain-containing protein [Tanacetum coccineum]|uniref:Reverse transcriptase domain-containing protein n=1 Tax=Tanacetum coccineum TaxID=301880 RepID=A0ABQ5C607_9ASTR
MAERTMEELFQAPTEGYGEAIVLPEINDDHFEIKTNLLQLVQANPFYGREIENPHAHISVSKGLPRLYDFRNVPNISEVLPLEECYSSKTDERIDKLTDQRSRPKSRIVSKESCHSRSVKAVEESVLLVVVPILGFQAQNNHVPNFQNQGFQNQPFQVPNNHVQQEISNEFSSYKRTNDQMMRNMQNQINSLKGEVKNEIQNTMKTQQAVLMNQQNVFQTNLQNMLSGFFQNQASTSGTLPSNTIPNPKGEMKAITTRSGVVYEGPSIPTNPSPKKVVERETEETTDKEQNNFQGSTAHIPPPVNPIPIPEPDVPKTLPKPNIPYPSRRNDQKSRDKASNQMEKIFQIFQDLRFDISFADALLLIPRFAPTIRSLLMNKEKLLELAKIPLNENCSAMLLKNLPEKLRDPGKFLIPCNFPGMDVCHALADLGASINLMPLSFWKKLSLPELTPTRMTLELADRSITHPKGLAEDVFVKVGKFHFPTDFVVVDFEADPRVPLILGRSFLRTGHALIDVYGEEITLRVDNEAVTFNLNHVNGTTKILKSFCPPPSEDVSKEKEKQEVKNLAESTVKHQTRITPCLKNFRVICKESRFHSNKTPQVSSVFAITSTLPSIEPKDSLIMGDKHLSIFSTEEIVPIPRESEETSRSDSKNVLPSCDDFSSIKDPRDDSVTFSNPLFEFNVNFNNPLFDEELEDIECKDSYDSNLDESTFLVTPHSNSNKDENLIPRDDIDFLLHDDPSTPLKSVASIFEGFIEDPPFEENKFDLESIEVPTYIEGYYDSEGDVLYLESLLSEDTTHNLSSKVFFDHEPQQLRNEPENEPLITFSPKSDPLHHEFTGELITIPLGIVREHEDYINRMSLLCSNSSSQSPENYQNQQRFVG